MKGYELLFVYDGNAYAFTVKEDALVSAIKRELKLGAVLTYIKEVK